MNRAEAAWGSFKDNLTDKLVNQLYGQSGTNFTLTKEDPDFNKVKSYINHFGFDNPERDERCVGVQTLGPNYFMHYSNTSESILICVG